MRGKTREQEYQDLDFEAALKIDPHSLDKEWLNQPALYARWSQAAADAERAAKHSDEKMKTVRSELILDAAKDPEGEMGIAKPTAAQVEAWYRTCPSYIKAKEELIEAEHTASLLNNALIAIKQRRDSLTELVRLHFGNYYAGPREPDNASGFRREAWEGVEDDAKTKAGHIIDTRENR